MFAITNTANSTHTSQGHGQIQALSHKFGRQATGEFRLALEAMSVSAADCEVVVSEVNYNHLEGAIKRLNHAIYQLDKCIVHIRVGLADDPGYQAHRAGPTKSGSNIRVPQPSRESACLMQRLDVMRVRRKILKDVFTSLCEFQETAQSPIAQVAAQQASGSISQARHAIAQCAPELNAIKKNLESLLAAIKIGA